MGHGGGRRFYCPGRKQTGYYRRPLVERVISYVDVAKRVAGQTGQGDTRRLVSAAHQAGQEKEKKLPKELISPG